MSNRSPIRSTPPPDEPKPSPGRKSSKWCKGKVGREHDWSPPMNYLETKTMTPQIAQRNAEIASEAPQWFRLRVRVCGVCGKQEYVK